MKTNKLKKSAACFIAGIIIAGIFFSACYEPTGPEVKGEYYYELFRISKANFNSVPQPTSLTFNSMYSYRNDLRIRATEFLGTWPNETRDSIYSFLKPRMAPIELDAVFHIIDNIGNCVIAFEEAISTSTYLIMYIEKYQ